jgi:hypothetical protein
VSEEHDSDKKSDIGLSNVRSAQAPKKQRMALQEADGGIDQIGEQDRETKDHKHGAGDVGDSQHGRE